MYGPKDVAKLLLVWMNESQLLGDSVSEDITCENVRALYVDLIRKKNKTRVLTMKMHLRQAEYCLKNLKRKPESTV